MPSLTPHLKSAAPEALAAWTERVGEGFTPDERVALLSTLDAARSLYGDRCTPDGEPWLDRALGTAAIVAGFRLDVDSVRAAMMLGAPAAAHFDADAFGAQFGPEVAQLVNGVARMGAIQALRANAPANERDAQSENLRKMLLAMVGDIRVVLIKLAERTQALRFLVSHQGDAAAQVARETQDLFAPLANRLGVWQLKWELEDLSLRALEPDTYKQIAKLLDERRLDRQQYIEEVKATLKHELAAAGRQGRDLGPPEAHPQHLVEDAAQAGRHRRALRHSRGAHPGRRDQGLLHRAGARAQPLDADGQGVRRLHRQAQGQQLSLAAHRRHRARGQAARGADPHA